MFRKRTGFTLFLVVILLLSVGAVLAQETTPEPAPPDEEIAPEVTPEPEPAGPGYLGIGFEPAVIITEVMEGTPAEEAGLQVGDRIVAVNDEPVNAGTLAAVVGSYSAGEIVTLSVERDGDMLEIELTLAGRPAGFIAPRGRFQQRHMPIPEREMEQFRLLMQPYLGVYLELVDDAVTITRVEEGSPAEDAGLLADDVIVSVNDEAVSTVEDVAAVVRGSAPGDILVLGIERDGEALEIEVELAGPTLFDRQGRPFGQMMPRGESPRNFRFEMMPFNRAYLGVQFEIVDEDVAAENNLNVTEGALIVEVAADSPAAEADLLPGDVIVSVDGEAIDADNTLADRIAAYEPGDTVTLLVIRDGSGTEVEITLAERQPLRGMMAPPVIITPEPEPEPETPEAEASV